MTANIIRLLWISQTPLSSDREARLVSKFEGFNELKVYTWPASLPEGAAEAASKILDAAERHSVSIISGEFEPNVAAQLARSQTYGGSFGKYIIALPLKTAGWEIFL